MKARPSAWAISARLTNRASLGPLLDMHLLQGDHSTDRLNGALRRSSSETGTPMIHPRLLHTEPIGMPYLLGSGAGTPRACRGRRRTRADKTGEEVRWSRSTSITTRARRLTQLLRPSCDLGLTRAMAIPRADIGQAHRQNLPWRKRVVRLRDCLAVHLRKLSSRAAAAKPTISH